ncbi:MAG TPA: von Willebrand factor type A domain-containing protein [Rugosimonospora sp.]|nr:von Willebrand factor type A domain-containing protein [Rugosimonospora sp.]
MAPTSRTRAALALLVVTAAILTGCSGTSGRSSGTSSANRAAPNGAAPNGLPGRPNPQGGAARPDQQGGAPLWYPTGGPDRTGFATETDARESPQSTFAMDVDTASYGYAGNLIRQGSRPAPQDVRPEDFINAFREDYPQPDGAGFSMSLDGTRLPEAQHVQPAGDVRLLRIGLQTRAESPTERPDAALTFVIDTSGSMGDPGKLDMVKQALHTLVDQLRPSDSVAIVTFSDTARVVRPMTRVTERADLHAAISRLAADGSTNLESGLVLGYQVAHAGYRSGTTNRVVLLSDGLANVGDTQAAPILSRVREEAAKQITLLGVGVGSDYGDALMEQLADHGDGYVVYVSGLDQTRRAFVDQLPATRPLRALDAKVQVTFDPRTVGSYRLIGYDDRALPDEAFRNDHVDGGEVVAGYSVTALYTVRLREGAVGQVAQAEIRWLDPANREAHEQGATIEVSNLDGQFADAPPRLQVCYAAAYFAEALRHSPYGNEISSGQLAQIAAGAADRTDDPAVTDLADLIRRTAG